MSNRSRVTAAAAAAMLCAATLTHLPAVSPAAAEPSTTPPASKVGAAAETFITAVERHNKSVDAAKEARAAAKQAAAQVRAATQEEIEADLDALAAAQTMRKLARQQYIAGPTADMETMVSVVTGGPETLSGLELAEVTRQRVGQESADNAADALAEADRAAAVTTQARVSYSQAAEAQAAAIAEVAASEGEMKAARAAYEQARAAAICEDNAVGAVAISAEAEKWGKEIAAILTAEGFTPVAIAAILGNLQQESGLDPTKHQIGGDPGRGLAQWSTGGRWDTGDRNAAKFAADTEGDLWTIETQVAFMLYEMGYGWGGFDLELFKKFTDVTDATVYFHDRYEKSADSADFVRTVRGGFAKQWFMRLAGGDGCGAGQVEPPEGLNVILPAGWDGWDAPGGSARLHPDARRIAQYVHATEPEIRGIKGWDAGGAEGHGDGLSVDLEAPGLVAARLAEFFATYAAQFGVERVRYDGREFNAAQPTEGGWDSWSEVSKAEEGEGPGLVHVTVWGGRAPERGAPNGLWAGR